MAKGKYKRKRLLRQRQQISVCDSGMSTRVVHRLENAGIMTLRDLDLYPEAKLETISGIGEASLKEIRTYPMKLSDKNEVSCTPWSAARFL